MQEKWFSNFDQPMIDHLKIVNDADDEENIRKQIMSILAGWGG